MRARWCARAPLFLTNGISDLSDPDVDWASGRFLIESVVFLGVVSVMFGGASWP